MNIKIQRYDIYTPADRDPEDAMGYEVIPHQKGEFTTIEDLIVFALEFPADHIVRTTLLQALNEQNYDL